MNKKEQEANAYFQLAKILATIAGFMIIASGIFYGLSSDYTLASYQLTIMLSNGSVTNLTNIPELVRPLALTSGEAWWSGRVSFYGGYVFIALALISWYYGNRHIH